MGLFGHGKRRTLAPPAEHEHDPAVLLNLIRHISEGFAHGFSSDHARWLQLSETLSDRWLQERVSYLLDDGWDDALAVASGQSADVIVGFARGQLEEALLPPVAACGPAEQVAAAINDGFKRAGLVGWLVGYAWWDKHDGWKPNGWDADAASLSQAASSALDAFDPAVLPDEVFYVLDNYCGQAVYGWTLKGLGVPATTVLSEPSFAQVIHRGTICLHFGWLVAALQHELGW